MDEKYIFRTAETSDIDSLIEFGRQEFSRTFGHLYAQEDLMAYLRDSE